MLNRLFGALGWLGSILVFMAVAIRFVRPDLELLRRAVGRTLHLEPRFACRFRPGFFGAYWSLVEDLHTSPPLHLIASEGKVETLHQVLGWGSLLGSCRKLLVHSEITPL